MSGNGKKVKEEETPPPPEVLRSKLHELIDKELWERSFNRLDLKRQVRFNKKEDFNFFPNYIRVKEIEFADEDGDLPIHLSLKRNAPLRVLEKIIKMDPGCLYKKDGGGELPLHTAIQNHASPLIVKTILEANPSAAQCQDNEHWALLRAISKDVDVEIIEILIDACPDALKKTNVFIYDSGLALHFACAPNDKSISSPDPLLETTNTERMINLLMKKYPFALSVQNDHGSTPLHYACEHKPTVRLLQNMFSHIPNGVSIESLVDEEGQLPLHIATDYGASAKVVETLLVQYPSGASQKGAKGYLPLHFAAYTGCTQRVLGVLLKAHPCGVGCKNIEGDTPMHILFSVQNYAERYVGMKGDSRDGIILGVEDTARMMLQHYARSEEEKRGVGESRLFIKRLLLKSFNVQKKSVIEMMNTCHEKYGVPKSLMQYLDGVAKGRIAVVLD